MSAPGDMDQSSGGVPALPRKERSRGDLGGSADGGEIDSYADLRNRIDTIKQEVDALQIEIGPKGRPWKRLEVLVPIIVSLAALVFTIVSSSAAETRITRQDQHAARAELRGIIQRLQALPKERFEISRAYASDAPAFNYLGGQITGEGILLAQQAAELIDQLEGEVGAQEYAATAFVLADAGQWSRAESLLNRGLSFAKDALSEATLLRQLGFGRFLVEDVEGGRAAFGQAVRIFEKYPDQNPLFIAATQAYTEASWARAEQGQHNCAEARAHVRAAETYVVTMPALAPAKVEVQTARANVQQTCGVPPA
jgi:hypothetical protein